MITIHFNSSDLDWARKAVETAEFWFPRFNVEGIERGCGKEFNRFRQHDLEMVVIARHWLEQFKTTKNVSRQHSSYGCKHYAENWAGHYISNASLIAAAAGLGITQKPCGHGSPNTFLALSFSSAQKALSYRYAEPFCAVDSDPR